MRCTTFLAPATAFILLGLVALATLAAALLHGPALAGLGIVAAFATPVLVSSEKPDFWALYLYLAVVTAAAFGLARIRLWRWLAVTTIVFALLWTLPCLQCGPSMVGAHAFHVVTGFILAALLVVCGFMFGPPADDGRIEPISSGSLAAYLLGATMIVLASFHADTAIVVLAVLVAATLIIAWRAPAATAAAILFTALLAFMEIRHAVNGGDVYRDTAGLTETALQVCVALAMAIGLERLRIRTGSIVHNFGAVLLTAFAGLAAIFGLLFLDNPAIWPIVIGHEFINQILLGYAMPAVLALLLSYAVAGQRSAYYANSIAAAALILALTYVSLEIRRLYHGPVLTHGVTGGAEQYTYSIAWLAFGVALLGVGIAFNSQRARLASAAVIALTIVKAFLIDMSTLTGVYRALSFMCLGLVLVAIGWLYQRVLFRRQRPPAAPLTQPGV
jgi:uncharacterized membrane protein